MKQQAMTTLEHRKTTKWSPEKVIERIKYAYKRGADLSDNTVNVLNPSLYGAAGQYFGGWQQAIEAAGLDYKLTRRTLKWSRLKIIELIKQAAQEGRPLTSNLFPSAVVSTALKYFGTWENLLNAAGYGEKPWARADQRVKNHIREYRKEAGLSEIKLGKVLGLSHRTISMIELAQMPDPRVSFAIRLARVLGKTVEEVFELELEEETRCDENSENNR
ncbi:MAG: helix-turn-helix domain-containing protein [Desulfotomaculaceae bacterium]|nr:helix-turn-helix domain-containing protein [Desulfotomaculaceae bacterium]